MVLYGVLSLTLLVGLLRGGTLRHLATLNLRGIWLIPVVVGPQLIVIFSSKGYDDRFWVASAAILCGSYLALVVLALLNHRLPGMKLFALGLTFNLLVILANGGFMPVTAANVAQAGHSELVVQLQAGLRVAGSKDVILRREDTKLWFLSDLFVIPRQYPVAGSFSIGDLLMMSGCFILIQWALNPKAKGSRVSGAQSAPGVE